MQYRNETTQDIEAIAALHADSWRRSYRGMMRNEYLDNEVFDDRLATWKARFENPDPAQIVILAEESGQLAGFICVYGAKNPDWGSLIDNLHVHHAFRRRGIAAELMRRAADALEPEFAGVPLFLFVLENNVAAQKFYKRCGSRNAGHEVQQHPDGAPAPCYRYTWASPQALSESIPAAQSGESS